MIAFGAAPALAADLPVKARPIAPAPVVYNWSGFYIGGFAGGDWLHTTRSYGPAGDHFVPGNTSISVTSSGFVGGGVAGYNWQFGQWVIGLEGTGAWSSINRTFGSPFASPVGSDPVTLSDKVTSIFTATAKAGWAFNQALWYVKGGYANVGLRTTAADPVPHTATDTERHNGWTVGTGLDYMLTQNWIIGVEYDYIRLTSVTHQQFPVTGVAPAIPTFYQTGITGDLHQIVGRLTYKFDWGGPVVARY